MDRDFYIYGCSGNSKDIYPNNAPEDFVIHFPKPVHLEGEWECGLFQLQYNASTEKPYYICCDVVSESYVGDHTLPILRRVRLKSIQYANVIYVPLRRKDFNSIRFYMRTWKNKHAQGFRGKTFCTLHFRQVL